MFNIQLINIVPKSFLKAITIVVLEYIRKKGLLI